MNRNFIFVFILLAALSMVNAIPLQKRTTDFGKCHPKPELPVQPEQISASISPDPIVRGKSDTFTVTGTLSKEITDGYYLAIEFSDIIGKNKFFYTQPMPPTKANTPFSVTDTVTVPADLSQAYTIEVTIGKVIEVSSPPSPDVIGCTLAVSIPLNHI